MKHQDIVEVLTFKRPNQKWTLSGDSIENLEWLDKSPKPTLEEIETGLNDLITHKQIIKAENEAKKALILNRLGITADEAKLLLS